MSEDRLDSKLDRMNEKAKEKEAEKDALKITNQFRKKHGMVYDVKCVADRLTLFVSPRENAADSGEWRVEASSRQSGETVITGWGATRTDALKAVAQAWTAETATSGLPTFDWDAIAKVLTSVRAL